MKVLVTGAGGYVGLNLVKSLLENKHSVIGCSRSVIDFIHSDFKQINCDLKDLNKISSTAEIVFEEIDAVFHTAATINFDISPESISKLSADNITANYQLAEFIINNKIKKLILSSSCSVYDANYNPTHLITEDHPLRPLNLYAVSKLAGEWVLENKLKGMIENFVVLRYSSIYGQGQRPGSIVPIMIGSAVNNRTLEIFGSGERIQDYVYIDDVIIANLNCLDTDFPYYSIFNIGSGQAVSDNQLAQTIQSSWHSKSDIIIKNLNRLPETKFCFSIEKAKALLNFSPVNLKTGLKRYRERSLLS